MVFWLASQVKKHCCAQQQSVHAAQSKGSRNRSSKHTHWTRRVPGKYTYLTWGMAVISASLCASTKQADVLFAVNLFTCVFACQAQRALASARLRSGWVRKARRVGKARVKARRQPGSPRSRLQMLIAAIFCSHQPVGYVWSAFARATSQQCNQSGTHGQPLANLETS